jgi:hypothetical protein
MAVSLTAERHFTFTSEASADRESMACIGAFAERALPVVHHTLADWCECVASRQRLGDSRIVIAPTKHDERIGVDDLNAALRIADIAHRPGGRVADDKPLIQLSDESGPDGKADVACEAQDSVVDKLIVACDQVRNTLSLLAHELRRPNPSQDNLAREGASWEDRHTFTFSLSEEAEGGGHSMIWSARRSIDGGMVRPSACRF